MDPYNRPYCPEHLPSAMAVEHLVETTQIHAVQKAMYIPESM